MSLLLVIPRLEFSRTRIGQKVVAEGELAGTFGVDLRTVPIKIETERVEGFNNCRGPVECGE